MYNRLVILLACLFFYFPLFSEINVFNVVHPSAEQSDGSIEIEASGNAGPFTVTMNGAVSCINDADQDIFICDNLNAGTYTFIITDSFGCEEEIIVELNDVACDIEIILIELNNVSSCNYCEETDCTNDGSIIVELEGTSLEFYEITWLFQSWPIEFIYEQDVLELTDIPQGLYILNLEHSENPDCNISMEYAIGVCSEISPPNCEPVDSPIAIDPSITQKNPDDGCNGFLVANVPQSPSNSWYWTDGTGEELSPDEHWFTGLCHGIEYCLVYENGCEEYEPICVTLEDCESFEVELISDCYKEEYDISDFNISGGTPPFSVVNKFFEYDGSQDAIVSSSNGCHRTIEISEIEFTATIEMEANVLYNFNSTIAYNNNLYQDGDATVEFNSDQFELGGEIRIKETGQSGSYSSKFRISIDYMNEDSSPTTFNYTYIAPDGCEYDGKFEIEKCGSSSLSADIVQIGSKQDCGPDNENTFKIKTLIREGVGPFYLKITMNKAHSTEEDYEKIIWNPKENDIITGVPSGHVLFRIYDKCQVQERWNKQIINCCEDHLFSCNIEKVIVDNEEDTKTLYFPHLLLKMSNLEFDDNCTFDSNCSNVVSSYRFSLHTCWIGKIYIDYPPDVNGDVDYEIIEVSESGTKYLKELEKPWIPPNPTGNIAKIKYVILNEDYEEEEICTIEAELDFCDVTNNPTYQVSLNQNPFSLSGEEWVGHHYTASGCKTCEEFEEDIEKVNNCKQNFLGPKYFKFVPFEIDYDNPIKTCDNGGTLYFIDYDDNNYPVLTSIDIQPNKSLEEKLILFTPWMENDDGCHSYERAGWCLFDALEVYGVEFEKDIIGIWGDEESIIPQPNWPDCGDIEEIGDECVAGDPDNCPEDLICVLGECVDPDDCDCDSDEICSDGVCYEYVCDFEMSAYSDHNEIIFTLHHNLTTDDCIDLMTQPYNYIGNDEDFEISGGVTYSYCRDYGEGAIFKSVHHIDSDEPIVFTFKKTKCGEDRNNGFNFSIGCFGHMPFQNEEIIEERESEVISNKVYPNPFNENFILEFDLENQNYESKYLIYNSIGLLIAHGNLSLNIGKNVIEFTDLTNQQDGVYTFILKSEDSVMLQEQLIKISSGKED